MRVYIKLFSSLKKHLPRKSEGNIFEIDIKPGSGLVDVVDQIGIEREKAKIFFLNGRKASIKDKEELLDDDVVTIFPRMAGG